MPLLSVIYNESNTTDTRIEGLYFREQWPHFAPCTISADYQIETFLSAVIEMVRKIVAHTPQSRAPSNGVFV